MISPTDYADLVVGLTNFIDSEYHLLAQIQHMKEHSDSDPPSGDLRRELAFFMNETQLRLEREKYSLLAKCSALEEEIL